MSYNNSNHELSFHEDHYNTQKSDKWNEGKINEFGNPMLEWKWKKKTLEENFLFLVMKNCFTISNEKKKDNDEFFESNANNNPHLSNYFIST